MAGLEEMVRKVESLLGTSGTPNVVTNWYAPRNGAWFAKAAWCDMTITWAAYHTGNYDAVCHGTDFAYTVYHANKFKSHGEWHSDVAGIKRGDIVFFDWAFSNSISAIDHVGIVTGVQGANILTVEGNTSNKCLRRVRQANTIAGYGRPKYATPAATPPPPPAKPATRSVSLRAVQPGRRDDQVLVLQQALKAEVGLNYATGPAVFGPLTQAAYKKWQIKLGYRGGDADGRPGMASLTKLGAKYGFTVKP